MALQILSVIWKVAHIKLFKALLLAKVSPLKLRCISSKLQLMSNWMEKPIKCKKLPKSKWIQCLPFTSETWTRKSNQKVRFYSFITTSFVPLNLNIFILEMKITLYHLFSAYGEVVEIVIKKGTKMRGQCFVVFRD